MEQTTLDLVVSQESGQWVGRVKQLPDVTATGPTKEACMENLKSEVNAYLRKVALRVLSDGMKD